MHLLFSGLDIHFCSYSISICNVVAGDILLNEEILLLLAGFAVALIPLIIIVLFAYRKNIKTLKNVINDLDSRELALNETIKELSALKLNDSNMKGLLDKGNAGYIIADSSGMVTFWSKGCEEITGLASENAVEKPVWNMIFELLEPNERIKMDLLYLESMVREILTTGEIPMFLNLDEKKIYSKGKIRTVKIELVSTLHDTGYGMMMTIFDITEQKEMMDTIIDSELKFRTMVDLSPQPVFEASKDGRLLFLSKAGFEKLGYSLEQFDKGISCFQLIVESQREKALQNFSQVLSGKSYSSNEYIINNIDGNDLYCTIHSSPIIKGGEITGLRGIVIDNTVQHKYELRIEESETLYRTLFENTGSATLIHNDDGLVLLCNSQFEVLSGYSKEEIENKMYWYEFVKREKKYNTNRGNSEGNIPGETGQEYEIELATKSGAFKNVSISINPLPEPGDRLVSLNDITEIKTAQATLNYRNEFIEGILSTLNVGLFVLEASDLKIRFYNKSATEIFELSDNDVIISEIIKQIENESVRRRLGESLGASELLSLNNVCIQTRTKRRKYLKIVTYSIPNLGLYVLSVEDVSDNYELGKKLREQELRYFNLIENMPIGYFRCDSDGHILEINNTFLEIMPADRDIIGNSADEYLKAAGCEIEKTYMPGNNLIYELKITESGRSLWLLIISVVEDTKTKVTNNFVLNITDRKHAENLIQENYKKIVALLDAVPDDIIIMNNTGLTEEFIPGNDSARRNENIYLDRNIEEYLPRPFVNNIMANIDDVIEKGNRVELEFEKSEEGPAKYYEAVLARYSGAQAILIVRDVTRMQSYVNKLSLRESQLSTFIEYIPVDFSAAGSNGIISMQSKVSKDTWGDMFGERIDDYGRRIISNGDIALWKDALKTVRAGQPHSLEMKSGNQDNRKYYYTVLAPMPGELGTYGILCVNIDISSIKLAEQQLKKLNSTKDKLFSIISHDLKNPINAFSGLVTMIHDNMASMEQEEIREIINIMKGSIDNVSALLQNLLNWSRVQRGILEYKPTVVNLAAIIYEVIPIVQLSAERKRIAIYSNVIPEINVHADYDMLNIILVNILTNAVKFTPKNGKIIIDAHQADGRIILSVADTGVGISPDHALELFREDQMLTTNGTDNEKGTGLGLILCQELITKQNGKLWYEANEPNGAVFNIELPGIPVPDQ